MAWCSHNDTFPSRSHPIANLTNYKMNSAFKNTNNVSPNSRKPHFAESGKKRKTVKECKEEEEKKDEPEMSDDDSVSWGDGEDKVLSQMEVGDDKSGTEDGEEEESENEVMGGKKGNDACETKGT